MKHLLLVLLACAVLLFGCLGQAPSPPAANAATPSQQGGTTAQPQQSAAHQSLVKALKSSAAWSASYSLKSGNRSYEFSQFVQGGNLRTDLVSGTFRGRNYVLGNKTYSCLKAGEEWSCRQLAGAFFANSETPNDLIYNALGTLEAKSARYTVASDSPMQVAGTSTQCYLLSGQSGKVRYCVSATGVPLYLSYSAAGAQKNAMELSAKQFGASVSAADFKLPAEPSLMPQ